MRPSQNVRDTFHAIGNYALVGVFCLGLGLLAPFMAAGALVMLGLIWFLAYGGRQGWGE